MEQVHRMDYIKLDSNGDDLRLIFLKSDLVFNTTSFILEFVEKTILSSNAERIILDISNVNHIDSSAVGMFISLKNGMQKSGKEILLAGVRENVLRILNFLDITDFLNLTAA
jgi:anti-anti-sigma factor